MTISNATILITGANRGIGRALLDETLERGAAKVYATYRSNADRTELESIDARVIPVQLDLGERASIDKLAHATSGVNLLINNAGVCNGANLLEDTEVQTRSDIETNFFGTLAVTKAMLPTLRQANKASIVNIVSISALAAMPSLGGYSVSKAAVHSLTQSLRGKLKTDSISVHGVYPGPVATRMMEGYEMETTPAPVVAANILDGVEHGVEEIFPDTLSGQVGPLFMSNPHILHPIEAVKNAENINPFCRLFDEVLDDIIGIIGIADTIGAAQQHLRENIRRVASYLFQPLPGVFLQKAHGDIKCRAAPAL